MSRRKNHKISPKSFLLLAASGLLIAWGCFRYVHKSSDISVSGSPQDLAQKTTSDQSNSDIAKPLAAEQSEEALPLNYQLIVPFTSQAPLYVWDATHEDACEEASLLMYYYWYKKQQINDSNEADSGILGLIAYEQQLGYGGSITLARLSLVADQKLRMSNGKVVSLTDANELKKIVANGYPVIVGAAGKILPNPNFRNGGPNYHMLVITGYDANGFITNDPGTRNGENFYYKTEDLFNAIHDWDSQDIMNGAKNALYFAQ